jgi:flagellar motility protein MotE (MotC chaperone)
MIPMDFVGTLPGWITAGSMVTLLGLILRYRLGSRKLDLEKNAQIQVDEQSIRDHYAKEVARLTQKLDDQSTAFRKDLLDIEERYRKLLEEEEERHRVCLSDRDALRKRVADMEDEWRGLIRVITQASIDKVLMLPGDLPDDIKGAADRVEEMIRAKGREPL